MMRLKGYDVAVVGGGASGMICALTLARAGFSVTLLEKNDRLGKKIAVSGNGQGNLTNVHVCASSYHGAVRLVERALSRYGYSACVEFYESVGCLLAEGKEGRVYPTSFQANSVVDNLRHALQSIGVDVKTATTVQSVQKGKREWKIFTSHGELSANAVVMAFGGAASPSLGTDGSAFELAKKLGHTVVPLRPSLVQLQTDRTFLKGLKGVKADVEVCVEQKGNIVARARGDVLFTDYGVSGNAVFTVSGYALDGKSTLVLRFLPSVTQDKLIAVLQNKVKSNPNLPAEELFSGILPKQIGKSILREVGVRFDAPCSSLYANCNVLAGTAQGVRLAVTGSTGLMNAQVTKGGIPETELTENLESKLHRGLYFTGEAVDVDGDCGGYNLHWAFASAQVVAEEILRIADSL